MFFFVIFSLRLTTDAHTFRVSGCKMVFVKAKDMSSSANKFAQPTYSIHIIESVCNLSNTYPLAKEFTIDDANQIGYCVPLMRKDIASALNRIRNCERPSSRHDVNMFYMFLWYASGLFSVFDSRGLVELIDSQLLDRAPHRGVELLSALQGHFPCKLVSIVNLIDVISKQERFVYNLLELSGIGLILDEYTTAGVTMRRCVPIVVNKGRTNLYFGCSRIVCGDEVKRREYSLNIARWIHYPTRNTWTIVLDSYDSVFKDVRFIRDGIYIIVYAYSKRMRTEMSARMKLPNSITLIDPVDVAESGKKRKYVNDEVCAVIGMVQMWSNVK